MNYLVVGLAKTGIETLKFMGQRGFNVRGTDNSPRKLLDDKAIIDLMESGIEIEFEAHSDEYLEWADDLIIQKI